jgi:hypothetical protein
MLVIAVTRLRLKYPACTHSTGSGSGRRLGW